MADFVAGTLFGENFLNLRGENSDAPLYDVIVLSERDPQTLIAMTPRLRHAGKEMMA